MPSQTIHINVVENGYIAELGDGYQRGDSNNRYIASTLIELLPLLEKHLKRDKQ